jgi:hypothetical protein
MPNLTAKAHFTDGRDPPSNIPSIMSASNGQTQGEVRRGLYDLQSADLRNEHILIGLPQPTMLFEHRNKHCQSIGVQS